MKYEMRARIILLFLHTSFFSFLFLFPVVHAQTSKKRSIANTSELNASPKYYRLAGLGSAGGDSTNNFPHPTVFLKVWDTSNVHITVRFPEVGLLGITQDTVRLPTFVTKDSLMGYKSPDPLYMLTFPKTRYFLFVDVWTKDGKKLLDSRPFEYEMDVKDYKNAKLSYSYRPTTKLSDLKLRRPFHPKALPFSIETNPGWSAMETLDSNMTYALVFRDPEDPDKLELSLTMRPASVGTVDAATWDNFKQKAEIAFGEHGVATSAIGDFEVADTATRSIIKAGFEFISKNVDSSFDYVTAYLTPRAILLLLAPMDEPNQQLQVQYFQAIARSTKSEP